MAISLENVFSIHDNALLLRSKRSSVLASNIANADTPNYKARDFDFAKALKAAGQEIQQITPKMMMASTHQRHISMPVAGSADGDIQLQYRNPLHASLDGNTVDSHVEQAKFSENALQLQSSFTFLNSKVRGLMKVIKGE